MYYQMRKIQVTIEVNEGSKMHIKCTVVKTGFAEEKTHTVLFFHVFFE